MKAYTTFKIKLDWLEVQKEAFSTTQDQINDKLKQGMKVEWGDGPDRDPSDPSNSDVYEEKR